MGLGERLNGIQEVIGSIPIISTKNPETFGFRIFSFLAISSALGCYSANNSRGQFYRLIYLVVKTIGSPWQRSTPPVTHTVSPLMALT